MPTRSSDIVFAVGLVFLAAALLASVTPRLRRPGMAVGGIVAAIGAVEAEGWLAKAWLAAMAVVVVVWFAMGGRPVAVGKR